MVSKGLPNMKALRKERGLTQEAFAQSIGLNKTTYSNYETGVREPNHDIIVTIARLYHVSTDYLLGLIDDPAPGAVTHVDFSAFSKEEVGHIKKYRVLDVHGKRVVDNLLDEEYNRMTQIISPEQKGWITRITLYDLAVSAGPGEPQGDTYYTSKLEIPTEQVPDNAHYCVRVNGDSMEPAYKDGDIVFVERLDGSVREGEIGIFSADGDGLIKKLGKDELLSLNPEYAPIPFSDYNNVICQGRALARYDGSKRR